MLNTINQLSGFSAKQRIIICIQKHKYYHRELELRYHDPSNGWIFVSVSVWKNSVNATIGGVGMLHALKSLNSIEKIQPRMMFTTFNG